MEKKKIIEYGKRVAEYILDGGLLLTLDTIGSVHTKAAKLSLKNINISKDKKRDLTIAIGHMQAAHIAYKEIHGQATYLGMITNWDAIDEAYAKDVILVYEIARCFALLGDEQKVIEYLKLIDEMNNPPLSTKNYPIAVEAIMATSLVLSPVNFVKSIYTEIFNPKKKRDRQKADREMRKINKELIEDKNNLILLSKVNKHSLM